MKQSEKESQLQAVREKALAWKVYCQGREPLTKELDRLLEDRHSQELYEAFYKDLTFGTGGLRGILGVGTNRMNMFTVARATMGLASYIEKSLNNKASLPMALPAKEDGCSAAISYDSRIDSQLFARTAAQVLACRGWRVYLYEELAPTPMLSFTVRELNCNAGIMITASHNPSRYNGYKAYNHWGCQMNLQEAEQVLEEMSGISMEEAADLVHKFLSQPELLQIRPVPQSVVEAYDKAVLRESTGQDCRNLSVVYTPLNGAGNKPVRRILSKIHVGKVYVVPEQELPDGRFPTCPYPNPEKREALTLGLEACRTLARENPHNPPDLLLATDPDCDRVGIAVRHCDGDEQYQLLTGNEVGVLLLDYLFQKRKNKDNPVVIKTIVTTEMAAAVTESWGGELKNVLTGFKFIGEQISLLEEQKQEARYLFGFEESYGYLSGTYARDKDAVNASMLICEMTACYKRQNKTLIQRLHELYRKYGYYKESLKDFAFDGAEGMTQMQSIMTGLRRNPYEVGHLVHRKLDSFIDYEEDETGLPKSDVLLFRFEGGCQAVVRPSGTEPKLKLYLSVQGSCGQECQRILRELTDGFAAVIHRAGSSL